MLVSDCASITYDQLLGLLRAIDGAPDMRFYRIIARNSEIFGSFRVQISSPLSGLGKRIIPCQAALAARSTLACRLAIRLSGRERGRSREQRFRPGIRLHPRAPDRVSATRSPIPEEYVWGRNRLADSSVRSGSVPCIGSAAAHPARIVPAQGFPKIRTFSRR